MEKKFKPVFQMIPVLADVMATSFNSNPGIEDESVNDDDGPILDDPIQGG